MTDRLADDPIARILSAASPPRKRGAVSVLAPSGELPPSATERPLRVAAYCRYSSHLQDDGYSIEMQHMAIEREREMQARLGVTWAIDWFDEPAKSAKAEKLRQRVIFLDMLRRAFAGEYDLIVVWKQNRFARSDAVAVKVLQELEAAGIGYFTVSERFDFTTPSGWLAARIHMVFAEGDNRERAKNITSGKEARASLGLHAGRAPFGYVSRGAKAPMQPDTREDETDAQGRRVGTWYGLQELGALLLQGMTDIEAAEAMNRDGRWYLSSPSRNSSTRRPFTRQSVEAIRRNVFYRPYQPGDDHGTIRHGGREYRGQHAAAWTWEQWHSMQQLASGRRRGWTGSQSARRSEPHTAEFRGLAACSECGGRLYVWRTVHDTDRRTGRPLDEPYIYERYVCLASERADVCGQDHYWGRVEDARDAWVRWLTAHPLPARWQETIRERAAHLLRRGEGDGTGGTGGEQDDPARAERERRRVEQKRRNAVVLFREAEIDEDEYRRILAECDTRLAELAGQARGFEQTVSRLVDAGRLLTSVASLWPQLTTQERQQAAALLIEPRGLRLRLLATRAYYNRWQDEHTRPPSCELVGVRLREPFRDLLTALQGEPDYDAAE